MQLPVWCISGVLAFLTFLTVVNAESPLICSYTNINGEFIELNWFPAIDKGQEYVDYGRNLTGTCIKRAYCGDNVRYQTKIEWCSDYNINCDNQGTYHGIFPACCVRC